MIKHIRVRVLFRVIPLILLTILFLAVFCMPSIDANAVIAEAGGVNPEAGQGYKIILDEGGLLPAYVVDEPGLLTGSQWRELEDRAEELSGKFRCDIRIVVVNDMEAPGYGSIEEFAYAIYTNYDLGYGPDKDCVLFVLSMHERDYDLRAWGVRAKKIFTYYGIDSLFDSYVLPLLRKNDYNRAFSVFLDRAELYFTMAEEGTPFDSRTDPSVLGTEFTIKLAIAILLPLLISAIVCAIWAGKMKTAKIARRADNYIPSGGFILTRRSDVYLYRTVTRTRIQTSSSSSGGGRAGGGIGGSSGRSGKF